MNRRSSGGLLLTLLFLSCFGPSLQAQEMPVPVDVQFSLFAKILSFDRNLKELSKDEITVGIIFQRTFRPSLHAKDDAVRAFQTTPRPAIDGKAVRLVELDISEGIDRLTAEALKEIDVLYISPLRAIDVSSIAARTQARRIRSLTGVPEYVAEGVAVGIGTRGERPEILINLSASKLEGADFSSQLLKLAKVIP